MQRFQEYLGRTLSFNKIVWLFFYVNMLNYIERFIISGSAVEIEEFVEQSVHGSKDTFLGLLQSAFILGFSIACIIFGYVVKSDSPFSIVCIGLLVWTVASLASGLAFNYWMLLFARLFSGVGEAAFQIVVPTFIDDFSPKDHVGTSMSRLYMAIPVGTAVGYGLSGFVAEYFSWRIMFLVSAPLMIPFIVVLHYYPISVLRDAKILNNDFGAEEPSALSKPQNDCSPSKESTAEAIGITGTYLSRLFRQELDTTFLFYLTNLRIRRAKQLLRDPRRKLAEIASSVGFQDEKYFCRVFKKITGQTPTDFRKS